MCLSILDHPLARQSLTLLRAVDTPAAAFREALRRLTTLLACEATRELPTRAVNVETPLCPTTGHVLTQSVALVPILRAGLGMVEPLLELLPEAQVWHLGIYRDEDTAEPVEYYSKLPARNPPDVAFVLDPMLATAGSATAALTKLRAWGVPQLKVLSIIAAQPGVDRLEREFPDVQIHVAALDPELNARKFIVPGLGDAGDRMFHTGGPTDHVA